MGGVGMALLGTVPEKMEPGENMELLGRIQDVEWGNNARRAEELSNELDAQHLPLQSDSLGDCLELKEHSCVVLGSRNMDDYGHTS